MKIRADLADHRKVDALEQLLDDKGALRALLRLWSSCEMSKQWRWEVPEDELPRLKDDLICRMRYSLERVEEVWGALVRLRLVDYTIEDDLHCVEIHDFAEEQAGLIQRWECGKRGGRKANAKRNPKGTGLKPDDNRTETGSNPVGAPVSKLASKQASKEEESTKEEIGLRERELELESDPDSADFDAVSAEQKKIKAARVAGNTPLMVRVGSLLRRRAGTRWTAKESRLLRDVDPSAEELAEVEWFYLESGEATEDKEDPRRYRRKNIETLLNNWPGEVDRAAECRSWLAKQKAAKTSSGYGLQGQSWGGSND